MFVFAFILNCVVEKCGFKRHPLDDIAIPGDKWYHFESTAECELGTTTQGSVDYAFNSETECVYACKDWKKQQKQ